ncbi:MAG: PorV/PorQ family protein [Candidatus Glassbacteria bacterium]|nr:PorV/PorQ family protein [Candidatus Glassbacteria bacterium]
MLKKSTLCAFISAGLVLLFVTSPVLAQGISRQEYTGLDKYLSQGRPDDFSFVGVRAAEFLTIPVGARGIALGSAYSAVCNDISAIWWNPAGLGFLEQKEVMFTFVDYTLDLVYSYAAGAVPVLDGRLVVGGFFGHLNIPEIEITTLENPNGTGNFYKAYDFQMGGSIAYNLSDRFTSGINLKYVHQDMLGNIGGNAFAVDAGAIYHTDLIDREIKFAFVVQNLGTNIAMDGPNLVYEAGAEDRGDNLPTGYGSYGDDPYAVSKRGTRQVKRLSHTYRLPTTVKVALAYNLYTSENLNFLASGEIWRNSNIPMSYAFGMELNHDFDRITSAALRFGWKVQTDEYTESEDQSGHEYLGDDPTMRGLSFGGGLKRNLGGHYLSFNYAYRNKGRLSADNFFTITFGF